MARTYCQLRWLITGFAAVREGRRRGRALCDHAFVTWKTFVLSLVAYEVFLIGTQRSVFSEVSVITTVVFTAFFLVLMRPWTLRRPSGSST